MVLLNYRLLYTILEMHDLLSAKYIKSELTDLSMSELTFFIYSL